ncbi:hypothetical protein PV326_001034, partial [Microctonus aethiopoides]
PYPYTLKATRDVLRTRGEYQAHTTRQSQQQNQLKKSSSGKLPQSTRTAHNASSTQNQTTKYPCDHCKGDHKIVSCPSFRELSIPERHKIITDKRLCFNWFGHHSLRS